jgi:hypothetical protein
MLGYYSGDVGSTRWWDTMVLHIHACMYSCSTHPFEAILSFFLLKWNLVCLRLSPRHPKIRARARSHMLIMTLAMFWTLRYHLLDAKDKTIMLVIFLTTRADDGHARRHGVWSERKLRDLWFKQGGRKYRRIRGLRTCLHRLKISIS